VRRYTQGQRCGIKSAKDSAVQVTTTNTGVYQSAAAAGTSETPV